MFTVAVAFMLMTAGIKETQGSVKSTFSPELFSSDLLAHPLLKPVVKVTSNYFCGFLTRVDQYLSARTGYVGFRLSQSPSDIGSIQGFSICVANSKGSVDYLWSRYQRAPLKVKILLVILVYLIVSLIVLFVSILIHRHYKTKQRQKYKDLKDEYQEQLASFLFDDEVERINFRGLNKKTNRQILIDELMDLHNNLHGEVADKLKDLYFNLSLHKDSLHKVYNGRWDWKAKGFGELAQMDVKDANHKISEYVNSKNQILRMEAQVAMVKLSENDPLGFLEKLNNELSHWEQINIYDTLVFHDININSFEKWLDSKNQSVVIFALRMIGLFKHVHSGEKVREQLFSDNSDIALAAVHAMRALELVEYVDDMKMLYRSETLKLDNILQTQRKNKEQKDIRSLDDINPRKIRYEIVQALRAIATDEDIPFLEQVMHDNDNSYKIRILAIEIMLNLSPQGEKKVNESLNTEDEVLTKMIINVKQNQES